MGFGWGLFVGMAGDNCTHAHHAVQIVLAETAQDLWIDGADWQRCCGAVIGPDVVHRLREQVAPVTLLYIEPDSDAGRCALSSLKSSWRALPDDVVRKALTAIAAATPEQLLPAVLAEISSSPKTNLALTRDAVIEGLIAGLPQPLPERLGIATLAKRAGLSPSRLQHRFRAHTGLALRPYLRWRRLLTAMNAVRQGQALTNAALDAGFADAAHFSRTVRRHFGITPSALAGLSNRPSEKETHG